MSKSNDSSPKTTKSPRPGLAVLYEPEDYEAEVESVAYHSPLSSRTTFKDNSVIAVHGIGANADLTWISRGVNWLQHPDMLPNTVPQARIMRFAYESQWLGKTSIDQHLSTIADQLLDSIRTQRQNCPERPIVFVCHCFGGIVIQKAIITLRMHREDWAIGMQPSGGERKEISDCITGIVFLGTPFRGSSAQSYAKTIGTILSVVRLGNSKIYDEIAPQSQALKDQLNDFVRIVNRQAIPTFCFFELHRSNLSKIIKISIKHYEIIVNEDGATIDGLPKLGLAADHFNMHRYSSPEDTNYEMVLSQLKRMIFEAPARAKARLYPRRLPLEEEEKAVTLAGHDDTLPDLRVENPLKDKQHFQKQIGEKDHETYQWVQVSGVYIRWLNKDEDSLLWIHGEEGQGKTPFTISLINALTDKVERSSRQRALAYVFCASRDGSRKDAPAMIRSIIHQIFCQKENSKKVLEPWRQEHQSQGEKLMGNLKRLWVILQLTLTKASMDVAYFVLYRPEECGASILDDFPQLLRIGHTQCHVKWVIISSKHPNNYPQIKVSRRINLANESVREVPKVEPSPGSSKAPTTPGTLDTRDMSSSRSTSSASASSMSSLREDFEVKRLVSMYVRNFNLPMLLKCVQPWTSFLGRKDFCWHKHCRNIPSSWFCEVQTNRQVSGSLLIKSTRLDQKGGMRHEISRKASVIPHTETSASAERKFAVSFLEAQEITLKDTNRTITFNDFPVYQFQDYPDFRLFQETVYGMRLLLLRSIHLITSNLEQESSRQDLRLWSSDDEREIVTLMFYTNSRTIYPPKEYYTELATSFKPIKAHSIDRYTSSLRLDYMDDETPEPSKGLITRMKRNFKKEARMKHLTFQFQTKTDRQDFLNLWPGAPDPKDKKPATPSDILNLRAAQTS